MLYAHILMWVCIYFMHKYNIDIYKLYTYMYIYVYV